MAKSEDINTRVVPATAIIEKLKAGSPTGDRHISFAPFDEAIIYPVDPTGDYNFPKSRRVNSHSWPPASWFVGIPRETYRPSEDYVRWMQALTKAALFYYATGVEPRNGSAFEARGCVFSI